MTENDRHTHFPFEFNKIFYGWWIVAAAFLISLYIGCIIFYGFTAFFDPLVKEFGWSYTQVSFASSLRGIEMSILSPLIGFLVDRYGPRKMIFWGVGTVGLGFILLSFTHTLWQFYISFILIGLGGGGCASLVLMRVVANWFQRDVGKAIGITTSGFGASGLMIPLLVWLIDDFGWRTAMVITGGGMLAIGIPLAAFIRNSPEPYGLHPDGRIMEPHIDRQPEPRGSTGPEVSFREAVKNKLFLFLSLSELLRMIALSAVLTHIMPYLSILQVPRATAGLIAGSMTILSIPGRFGFGWLADHFNKQRLLAISYGMASLGMLALCFADTTGALWLFLALFPAGFGSAMVLRAAILRESFGREGFGRLFGLVMGAAGIGGVIGPTLAGFVFDTWQSYTLTWLGMAIATALPIVLMLVVTPKRKSL